MGYQNYNEEVDRREGGFNFTHTQKFASKAAAGGSAVVCDGEWWIGLSIGFWFHAFTI